MKSAKILGNLLFNKNSRQIDPSHRRALISDFEILRKRWEGNRYRFPDLDNMRERLVKCREESVADQELLQKAVDNLRLNCIKVHVVDDVESLFAALMNELGDEKFAVKSRSSFLKELHLVNELAAFGVTAVETDIGDRIIQLAGQWPSHLSGPVTHLDKEAIAELLELEFDIKSPLGPDPGRIVAALRDNIKESIAKANIGISGVNAITAAEGSVVIIHDEGNVSEISRLPEKHIMLADSYKIYPDLEAAINMVKLQTYYATGAVTTSYINVISGVSKTADMEKQLFYGVHGTKEVVLILLRRENPADGFKQSAHCIGCGACLLECPAYLEKGNAFGAYYKRGGIGIIQSALNDGLGAGVENGLYSCLKCGVCVVNCPVSIDTPKMIGRLRDAAAACPGLAKQVKPYKKLAGLVVAAANAEKLLNFPSSGQKAGVAYFPGCVATINAPGMRADTIKLLKLLNGVSPRVIEGCCGGVWETFGFKQEGRETFEKFLKNLSADPPKQLIVSCPHCYDFLWVENKQQLVEAGVESVLRLTEAVQGLMPDTVPKGQGLKLAFHDSCIYGRKMGLYGQPRNILRALGGDDNLVEMRPGREMARCCGFYLLASDPKAARAMAQRALDSAENAGADTLIISECPGCYCALRDIKGVKVENISGFMYQKIRQAQ